QALVDPTGFASANPGFDSNIYGDYDASQLFDVQDYEGFYHAVTGGVSIAGDYNLDGTVDASDYAVWKSAFGLASVDSLIPADGNGDGVVDPADYTVWRNNLGASTANLSLNSATAKVPEPTTIVMGMSVLVAGL